MRLGYLDKPNLGNAVDAKNGQKKYGCWQRLWSEVDLHRSGQIEKGQFAQVMPLALFFF